MLREPNEILKLYILKHQSSNARGIIYSIITEVIKIVAKDFKIIVI